MGGDRPFDDDRFADEDGHACCFMCGRPVDPRDPKRCSYTPNARACEPLPAHQSCLAGDSLHMERVRIAAMTAFNQMGSENIKRAREAARCAVVPPGAN